MDKQIVIPTSSALRTTPSWAPDQGFATAERLWRRWSNTSLPILIASVAPAARVVQANAAFRTLLGFGNRDLAGTELQVLTTAWKQELAADAPGTIPRLVQVEWKGSGGQPIRTSVLTMSFQTSDPPGQHVMAISAPPRTASCGEGVATSRFDHKPPRHTTN